MPADKHITNTAMPYFREEIEAMAGYAPGEQPQAGKFIKLNTNENPYPPSPAALRTLSSIDPQKLRKYPDPMADSFRICAAERFGVERDWILCGNGSDDLLTIVTRALVGNGERMRIPYPSYVLYKTLAEIQGAVCEDVKFREDWSLSTEFAQRRPDLKLVFLPNPNSPSGTMVPPSEVLTLAEELPCPILVDEAYVDFASESCVSLVAQCEKIMVSRTLSKSHALAGLRFGYLIAQPHLIAQLVKVKDSYNCDALSIAAATAAFCDQQWLAETRDKIIASRDRLVTEIQRLGFQTPVSHANFVWCVHPTRPVRPLYEQLKADQVLVRYMNYPDWGEGLRITVGTDEQIDACIGLLEQNLAATGSANQ